jgi:hypothetical protein
LKATERRAKATLLEGEAERKKKAKEAVEVEHWSAEETAEAKAAEGLQD